MKMIIPIIFIFCLFFSFSSSEPSVFDFCVADFSLPYDPAGYSCKNPKNVTANDFHGTVLGVKSNTANIFKTGETTAFVQQIPGLNGLSVSMARVDVEANGVVPLHTHPDATEILYVMQGQMLAGFISSDNVVYLKTLNPGDVFVFPQGLLHFQLNEGRSLSVGIAGYSSSNPRIQIVDFALFQSNLTTQLITAVTFINILEAKRLKIVFGGSG
ncbi:germin-like protein [Prosopis cineraria]|uniref:germin-like protein n=1 Tax=Prosopis cineraria TaxID=364024 RepID=UPI0024109671|nr:germin-like protein [Prosopis cineraria]